VAALRAPRPGAAERPGVTRLLPARADPFFRAERVDVSASATGPVTFEPGYAILVVVSGHGQIGYASGRLPVRGGATVLVPYGAGPVTLEGSFLALRCRPPAP
jgi:mannose-6-phosphate isomerase